MRLRAETTAMPSDSHSRTHYDDLRAALSRWRKRTISLLWLTYASFYLCRVNLAAAQKDLATGRGLSKNQLGRLIALLKVFYATGQFVNGALADRFGPRLLVAVGLTVSAGLNLLFAHLNEFRWMAVTWAANGYFQACGWTPVVRTIANWFPPRLRDAASGLIGTSYILGSGISWVLAGSLTEVYGWRYAFWVPAWVCLAVMVVFVAAVRERPEDVGLGEAAREADSETSDGQACLLWRDSLRNPRLWVVAGAMACFTFGYHGLLDWTPHYLAEAGDVAAGAAASRAFLMPIGGTVGCLLITWASRRRSAALGPAVVVFPLLLLAALTYSFPTLTTHAPRGIPLGLALLGMLSSAPASIIACAMPANVVGSRAAGAAAGLVDSMGYLGSAFSGWASGSIMERVGRARGQAAAWRAVWHVWPIGMVMAAGLVALSARCGPAQGNDRAEGDD